MKSSIGVARPALSVSYCVLHLQSRLNSLEQLYLSRAGLPYVDLEQTPCLHARTLAQEHVWKTYEMSTPIFKEYRIVSRMRK